MSILTINDLTIGFPNVTKPVVESVSFDVHAGKTTALVGESGSGKSVTALSILGLSPAAQHLGGTICYQNSNIVTMSKSELQRIRGNHIGIIFQEPMTALNPLHNLGKQLAEIILLHQPEVKSDISEITNALLEEVGLGYLKERLHHYPHQLSGGERQRIMIAMAIANRPDILIADEPTTALDVTTQAKIIDLLKELQAKRNMALLLITHDLHLVKKIADTVVVMKQGNVVETNKTELLFNSPTHEYTKALLNSRHGVPPNPVNKDSEVTLETEGLSVYYSVSQGFSFKKPPKKCAVQPVSLRLLKGETLGIVGESGSGKTSLGLAIARLIASDGNIIFQNNNIANISQRELRAIRKELQFVFQDPFSSLNPRMTIEGIITEGLHVHESELPKNKKREKVSDILSKVGLCTSMLDRYPHEFSGGQRQRINIARALILKPQCIIFDEPTSALDMTLQTQIIETLKKLQESYEPTYIFISHDLSSVNSIAHKILVMKSGGVVEFGEASHIMTSPKHEYTKSLLEATLY